MKADYLLSHNNQNLLQLCPMQIRKGFNFQKKIKKNSNFSTTKKNKSFNIQWGIKDFFLKFRSLMLCMVKYFYLKSMLHQKIY